jgi:hypothetical protein
VSTISDVIYVIALVTVLFICGTIHGIYQNQTKFIKEAISNGNMVYVLDSISGDVEAVWKECKDE